MNESLNIVRVQQRQKLVLVLLILTALISVLSSCSSVDMPEMSPGTVSLTVNISRQSPTIVTRAISDAIDNIDILVFDGQGHLIGSVYTSTGPASVTLPTRFGSNCTICAVANTGGSSYLDGISTLTELRAKVTAPVASATTLAGKTNEILYGEISGLTINASTPSQSVILKRLYSRYTFTITPSSDITITDYQLCNVPNECFIASGNSANPTIGYSGLNYSSVTTSASAGGVVTAGPYYVYENLAGKNSLITAAEQRTIANAPSGASYILINAKRDVSLGAGWKSTYSIYLGGVTSATTPVVDYTDFNIYRNYDYNCNISISGSGANDARVTYTATAPAALKQFLFSDGTCGKISDNPGKTPIAIVFCITPSTADKAKNYHGYAMALKNASTCLKWGPTGSTPTGSASTTLNITDYDGLTYTGKINNSTYPAAYAAASTFKSTVPAPSGTSGWYLPSIGQWYQICLNLGGMSTSFTDGRSSGYLYWAGRSTACANAINTAMSEAGSGKYDEFSAAANQFFWSSSEYGTLDAYRAKFLRGGNMYLSVDDKGSGYSVRPVIAF